MTNEGQTKKVPCLPPAESVPVIPDKKPGALEIVGHLPDWNQFCHGTGTVLESYEK
jgi:hypothetical protein